MHIDPNKLAETISQAVVQALSETEPMPSKSVGPLPSSTVEESPALPIQAPSPPPPALAEWDGAVATVHSKLKEMKDRPTPFSPSPRPLLSVLTEVQQYLTELQEEVGMTWPTYEVGELIALRRRVSSAKESLKDEVVCREEEK